MRYVHLGKCAGSFLPDMGHRGLVVESQDAPLIKETIKDKHMLP